MDIRERISELRKLMQMQNIDTYIITKFDPHQTEYADDYWNGVKFISGFTGSTATVVITKENAGLWTDGRYYIQASRELKDTGVTLFKEAEIETISINDFCKRETKENGVISFDGRTMSKSQAEKLYNSVKSKKIEMKTSRDLLQDIWTDRSAISKSPIFDHDVKYAGKSRLEKIAEIREKMKSENADVYVLSSLDDIAWLFNLRGNDTVNLTTFFSYAVISMDSANLFIDEDKLSDVKDVLNKDNIITMGYNDIYEYLKKLQTNSKVMICPDRNCYELYKTLSKYEIIDIEEDITTILKASKNETEIKNLEAVNIKDSVAMLRFIKWLKEEIKKSDITEYDVVRKVLEFRSAQSEFLGESFDTIAAYMENAAMMHYSPKECESALLKAEGILLLDSGGHYMDGTTDITRTIVLGDISDRLKRDFTLTLKSVIALTKACFLHGTTGTQLDILARKPMWENLMDYKCGTGHGIGFCLNVHEGPHRISPKTNTVRLEAGMITSNEPGVYIEGKYGIRTENTLVVEELTTNEFGKFMKFRTLSFCPIDLDGIDTALLTDSEKSWLNKYHKETYEKLSPFLDNEEKEFLKHETRQLH